VLIWANAEAVKTNNAVKTIMNLFIFTLLSCGVWPQDTGGIGFAGAGIPLFPIR